MNGMRLTVPLLMLTLGLIPTAGIAADTAAGQAIFNRCKICHTLESGDRNTVGPNLHGVFGRKAGTSEGFVYSEGMKSSGITWDDEQVAKYLHNPREFIPGNKMAFPGIKDDKEMADLLAYLHEATK